MRATKKKFRVIVRPFIPRKVPYQIPTALVDTVIQEALSKLKKVVYVGWNKRVREGKKQYFFFVATGDTGPEARKIFKTSENFGEDIWLIE
ncbi:MAG TPA: hypothetical protein VNW29_02820 [Candidatus Sulfotelmatobacter sp.]|jgi:hypothetical protein|nr:hypothetical protein [Candidatus Sulfotelmatobacter sp.]